MSKTIGNIGNVGNIGETIGDISSTIGETGNSSQTSVSLYYRPFGLSREIILVIVEVVFTVDYLFTYMFFFSEIVLWGNHLINRVVLFEEKSILAFPECLEASEW